MGIWGLALGYFAFYIPYSALAKALSQGLLPGVEEPVSGFVLLPVVAMTTSIMLLVLLTLTGAWKYARTKVMLGISLPMPRPETVISGLATAVIIATTTLSYTFVGISIVFALLLMRGGVLVMSPVVDTVFRRSIHWYSWVALALSLTAIAIAFSEKSGYSLSTIAICNIGAYLLGYLIRLQFMTRIAKSERKDVNLRYFVEETLVAAVALTLVPAVFAVIGKGALMLDLRAGFTSFLASNIALPTALVGMIYACLYFFGTRIYLDRRENTFCIPLNRCSSLLSGVVASYVLTISLGLSPPSPPQLSAAGLLICALVFLRAPEAHLRERVFLFVCEGNRARSPLAQAFCHHEALKLQAEGDQSFLATKIRALSAGLSVEPGRSMNHHAAAALQHHDVDTPDHRSQHLTHELIEDAHAIFCMNDNDVEEVVRRFSSAKNKTSKLDPSGDIPDLHHDHPHTFIEVSSKIREAVRTMLARELPEQRACALTIPLTERDQTNQKYLR